MFNEEDIENMYLSPLTDLILAGKTFFKWALSFRFFGTLAACNLPAVTFLTGLGFESNTFLIPSIFY